VLVAVSAVTYRYVEVPFQRLGRRLNRPPAPAVRPVVMVGPVPSESLPK